MSKRKTSDGGEGEHSPTKLGRRSLRSRKEEQDVTSNSSDRPQVRCSTSVKRLVAGSYHQGDAQFNPETRNRQSVLNCLGAIIYHTVKDMSQWDRWDLDNILTRGDTLCKTLQNTTKSPDCLKLEDMPSQIEIGSTMYYLETGGIVGTVPCDQLTGEGRSKFESSLLRTLEDVLTVSYSHLVRYGDQLAALVHAQDTYYFFDPFSRNTLDGLPVSENEGVCVLVHFSALGELVSHLSSLIRMFSFTEDDAVEITSIKTTYDTFEETVNSVSQGEDEAATRNAEERASAVLEAKESRMPINGESKGEHGQDNHVVSDDISRENQKEDNDPPRPSTSRESHVENSIPSGNKLTDCDATTSTTRKGSEFVILETPSDRVDTKLIVWANYHQGNSRFSEKTRGRQCVPNSLGAIVYNNMKNVSLWTTVDLDRILQKGDELYERLRTSSAIKNDRLLVAELPTELEILGLLYVFEFSEPYVGLLWQTSSIASEGVGHTCEDALLEVFKNHPSCLVSFGGNTEAIIEDNSAFYMFDPHSRSRQNGHVSVLGTCVLIRIETIADLLAHLLALGESMHISKEEQFEITGVTVYDKNF